MKKFEQLKKLYNYLSVEAQKSDYSKVFISGITADFDRLFELSWKTMKEYLYNEKNIINAKTGSPKDIIKLAYQQALIDDENNWIILLKDRNDDSHQYSESEARSYLCRIQRDYLNIIKIFIERMSELIEPEPEILAEIPESFLESLKNSGMYYDEFLNLKKKEFGCDSDLQLFEVWKLKHDNQNPFK